MSPVRAPKGGRGRSSPEEVPSPRWELGPAKDAVERCLAAWREGDAPHRFWRKDPTLWPAAAAEEVRDRMGWLELPDAMSARLTELSDFAEEVRREGFRHVVVLGMGGSSLAPDVFARTYETPEGYPELFVLDSTHPAAVAALSVRLDLARTLFLVSSKSGTTTEPDAFFRFFFGQLGAVTDRPGRQFVAITDPGTPLETLARDRSFRRVFTAPPDVGGRYSALTVFGLVPAALHGVPIAPLLERALRETKAEAPSVATVANPGFALGAALGELARAGRDKVTFLADPPFEAFPDWVEQLIAESTGKAGTGIVPVVDEPEAPIESYGADRVFVTFENPSVPDGVRRRGEALARAGQPVVRVSVSDPGQLGAEFFRWESAVAMAGAVLGIDPYDQPDVELAKQLAREAMSDPNGPGRPP